MNSVNDLTFGIGTDIEGTNRFKDCGKKSHFLSKIFTENELDYCFSKEEASTHLAARFAGKEAVIKAFSSIGVKDIFFKDVEILNEKDGIPYVKLNKDDKVNIKISLSHSKEFAVAFAIVFGAEHYE